MGWLVGALLLAGLAQPQFPTAAFVDSSVTAGCGDTDLPVTVDNRGLPARDAVLELRLPGQAAAKFQLPDGKWQDLLPTNGPQFTSPQVRLPANATAGYRFRLTSPPLTGGKVDLIVRAQGEQVAFASTSIQTAGPLVHIVRPVPNPAGDLTRFQVELRNDDPRDYPNLELTVLSNTAPTDKLRGANGVTVEVNTSGTWRSVSLRSGYGWSGTFDAGPLRRGTTKIIDVRARGVGEFPIDVLPADPAACGDGFLNQPALPPARRPIGLMLGGLGGGLAAGVLITLAAVWLRRRVVAR